ncbi:tight adherence protein D [Enterobacter sp. BIGb0383]|uniref:tetratricopeptide repeat protein n=1 Tax=unclassified Enterobacter TaxID=2608935 RepID=UPI000F4A0009|nr:MULTISPECIES: tetratricopeptide repeat protein [unclassified Enterobacter]ROP59622.1 tight adherence protein D [Enterobacter sp. BIGb0383]ROS08910.1 tight adherence protein D [Enterobacter sp. BIGb0359]
MGKLIYLVGLLSICLISGCQRSAFDEQSVDHRQKEYLLSKVNNYQGLISLYREKLSQNEHRDTRYRLAELYYQVEDYESSRHYLKPLLDNAQEEKGWLLESKNLLEMGKAEEALAALERVQRLAPESGEAWNLRGVLLAQSGDFPQAEQAFGEARLRFVDDKIVLNNLAMLAIMQENYMAARDYLMPLYARGNISQKMLHNLVFVLVKLKDFQGAEEILRQEKMVDERDGLLESLARIKPRSPQQLRTRATGEAKPAPLSLAKAAALSRADKAVLTEKPVEIAQASVTPPVLAPTPSPIAEQASLSVTGNLREISVMRAGQHTAYFRIALESSHAINYREVAVPETNRRVFELYNVRVGSRILSTAQHIAGTSSDIKNVSFSQKDESTMMMTVDFRRDVNRAKVFRLAKSKQAQERLIFDIFYG